MSSTVKRYTLILLSLLLLTLGLPGLMGYLAKSYIDRAIELTNLNTAITLEITHYEQYWFKSDLTISASIPDPYEDEQVELGKIDIELKHGPITLVNNHPGFGAFFLYSKNFTERSSNTNQTYVGYARAGFTGNIELNLNLGLEQNTAPSPTHSQAHTSPDQEKRFSALIISMEADSEFSSITYRMLWPGINLNDINSSQSPNISGIRLSGALSRMDDERWQGFSRVQAKIVSLPESTIHLEDLDLTIRNNVRISESDRSTKIYIEGQATKIQTLWNNWKTPSINAEIQRADITALSDLYDLAERVYLESDSALDEYAQMEYMTALQTLIPALLSDRGKVSLNNLSFELPDTPTEKKRISGSLDFPDLPDYMDDHLLSLVAQTNGSFNIETLEIDSLKIINSETVTIKKGRLSLNNQPFDPSFLN